MRKLVSKAWVTLDGVFDADTMDQWFNPYQTAERNAEIKKTVLESDAMLYGRTTYEMLAPYWSKLENNEFGIADKLNSVPKYVVSTTLKSADWNNSTIISENVVEEITKLKQQPGQQILLDGSATLAHSLMETGLIDEYRFLVHPYIMGSGKRFFPDGIKAPLKLVSTKTLDSGVVVLYYQPNKKGVQ
jgi:dihydrofolate reductase